MLISQTWNELFMNSNCKTVLLRMLNYTIPDTMLLACIPDEQMREKPLLS